MKRTRFRLRYLQLQLKVGTVHRLTADKMETKGFPKLPSATSFVRIPLCAIRKPAFHGKENLNKREN